MEFVGNLLYLCIFLRNQADSLNGKFFADDFVEGLPGSAFDDPPEVLGREVQLRGVEVYFVLFLAVFAYEVYETERDNILLAQVVIVVVKNNLLVEYIAYLVHEIEKQVVGNLLEEDVTLTGNVRLQDREVEP